MSRLWCWWLGWIVGRGMCLGRSMVVLGRFVGVGRLGRRLILLCRGRCFALLGIVAIVGRSFV